MDACDSRLTAEKEVVALASGDTVDEMDTREGRSVTYRHQRHQHDKDTRHLCNKIVDVKLRKIALKTDFYK